MLTKKLFGSPSGKSDEKGGGEEEEEKKRMAIEKLLALNAKAVSFPVI